MRRAYPESSGGEAGLGVAAEPAAACCAEAWGSPRATTYLETRPSSPPFDGSSSIFRIAEDGRVLVFQGECDMGQGQTTVFAQVAADALGARLEDIVMAEVDTQISPFGLGSFATRGTTLGGMGVKRGAEAAKEMLLQAAAEYMGVEVSDLDTEDSEVYSSKDPEKRVLAGV